MSDPRTATTEESRPWAPGPWSIGGHGVLDANGKLVHRDPCGPNVKLEALAPEMAEVIMLEADHHASVSGCEFGCETCATADKLRAEVDRIMRAVGVGIQRQQARADRSRGIDPEAVTAANSARLALEAVAKEFRHA